MRDQTSRVVVRELKVILNSFATKYFFRYE